MLYWWHHLLGQRDQPSCALQLHHRSHAVSSTPPRLLQVEALPDFSPGRAVTPTEPQADASEAAERHDVTTYLTKLDNSADWTQGTQAAV
eukprot:CAMPEP_0204482416 /NCGR_PEP_ID=MMETSP0471-20130131/50913_1 /ASSEMBLY_ACC=CAM_ASM_000602 /TAXON_ID=2969 /ORGANISM="Oxyrrhis marina" /LENGTH=89 /DNA_ID=CAMNT_0051485673 /DNA_START=37 /DNA_END=303 /DNA_ORIENTATION=+